MKCINFDDKFADFASQWMKDHGKEYRNYDAMEADMPRVYMMFLNTPAKWLDGVTPGAYFTQFEDAKDLVEFLGIRHYICNIKDATSGALKALADCGLEPNEQARINLPPRIRMSTLYAVSQTLNGRVANTCNLSEDWVGYSTRYGDSVGDFSPLSRLTVAEVKEIGYLLDLPRGLVDKIPIDGLCGKTDEENLGFTYAELDRYIRTGEIDDPAKKALIDRKHAANLFKLQLMPTFEPEI